MSKGKTIYLIRHGECQHNLGEQAFAGSDIDNSLSETGHATARKLAKQLAGKGIDLIFESPLKRSKETALIISKELKVPIIEMAELSEINVGKFSGKTRKEVEKKYPEESVAFYSGEIRKWAFPEGENFMEIVQRIEILLQKINDLKAENILLAGHGMLNRAILFYLFPSDKLKWQPTSYSHDRIEKITLED